MHWEFLILLNFKTDVMKKNYLLPNRFKRIGMVMFVPFFAACLWLLFGPGECSWFSLKVPALVSLSLNDGFPREWLVMTVTDPVNEVCMAGLLVSLAFMALSKEKDEDEMTMAVRMQSFVWSFWISAVIILVGIVLTYDLAFLNFAFISMFVSFILYICKFNYEMIQIRRSSHENK